MRLRLALSALKIWPLRWPGRQTRTHPHIRLPNRIQLFRAESVSRQGSEQGSYRLRRFLAIMQRTREAADRAIERLGAYAGHRARNEVVHRLT